MTHATTTAHEPSTAVDTDGAPPIGDPRPLFSQAVAVGRTVLAGIRADQFDAPTPCTEFDVRRLVDHLVMVLERVAIIGVGGHPADVPQHHIADDAWVQAYDNGAAAVERVWSDDTVLTSMLHLPWMDMPGTIALLIYINEVTVHTWDLAVATGQTPDWDAEVVATALESIQRGLPAEGRSGDGDYVIPFDDVVETHDDAPTIDRLVAWNGRRP
jgi:uncharacterized protein (TIGR03086 family)